MVARVPLCGTNSVYKGNGRFIEREYYDGRNNGQRR